MEVKDTKQNFTVNPIIGILAHLLTFPPDEKLAEMSVIPKRAIIDLAIALAYCRWAAEVKRLEKGRQTVSPPGPPIKELLPPSDIIEGSFTIVEPKVGTKVTLEVESSDGKTYSLKPWLDLWQDDDLIESGIELPSLDEYIIKALLECQRGSEGFLANMVKELGTYEFAAEQMEQMEGMRAGGGMR